MANTGSDFIQKAIKIANSITILYKPPKPEELKEEEQKPIPEVIENEEEQKPIPEVIENEEETDKWFNMAVKVANLIKIIYKSNNANFTISWPIGQTYT